MIVTAHCENEDSRGRAAEEAACGEGKTGPEGITKAGRRAWKPKVCITLMTFAEMTGAAVYIVHLSCEEALREALAARQRGVRVWVETLFNICSSISTDAEKPDFEGAQSSHVAAAARQEESGSALERLAAAQCFRRSRPITRRSILRRKKRWAAMTSRRSQTAFRRSRTASISTSPTASKVAGSISITFVDIASTQAAKIFGLFPRKGTIQPGSDADLVVYDPNYRGKISARTHQMNLDYNAFEGFEIEGRPDRRHRSRRGRGAGRTIRRRDGPRKISHARAESFLDFGERKKRAAFAKSGRTLATRLTQAYPHEDEYFAGDRTVA